MQVDLRPRQKSSATERSGTGQISAEAITFWGTSQAAIALACIRQSAVVGILPTSHNVPLHYFDQLHKHDSSLPVHVHYHWLNDLDQRSRNPLLDGRMPLPSSTQQWLLERLEAADMQDAKNIKPKSLRQRLV